MIQKINYLMGNNYKSILLALVLISPLFVVAIVEANPVRQYMEIDRADLKLLIGEKLYNQPGDGCWSCHGAEGIKIIKKYAGESEMLSQRDISLSLVRLGADEWNKELAPRIREYTGSNIIFFDEQMIGIHSKLLKKNARSISRTLKREKVKFKGRDIMDIMSTSVFYYIENKFVGNE